ncbi:ferritin-like domain-containing protein [Nocardioides jensenii]|uniref:ferritin-like domain-containing protein n=1 Tax=Nocardioides jensenii TaxID=1843 RepID=UPI00082DAF70|nr:ferritin-like domain-containing protein [Nocardioides jensenii]
MSPVESLQTTLAAEHAAVWLYGVLGGQTSQTSQPRLYGVFTAAYAAHRGRRDQLVRWILDADAEPVVADVAYELPNPARTPAQLSAIALQVEQRCAATYADLVARTVDDVRAWGVTALIEAAVRQLDVDGEPTDLPGIDT